MDFERKNILRLQLTSNKWQILLHDDWAENTSPSANVKHSENALRTIREAFVFKQFLNFEDFVNIRKFLTKK